MARHLYRFYLYVVFIALLIFGAVAIGMLLNTLLLFTPLRGPDDNSIPTASEVTQSVIFTLISLLIAGALAGLHYWLIRRDMQNDPAANGSAIRALLLNLTEAVSISAAVPIVGYGAWNALSYSTTAGVVFSLSTAIPALALAGGIELERRRTQVDAGVALTFQRLHFYIVQLILLVFLAFVWISSISTLFNILFFSGNNEICGQNAQNCASSRPVFLALELLWFLAFWLLYSWATRNDTSPLMRLLVHYVNLITGLGFTLYGLYQIVQIIFLDLFHLSPSYIEVYASYAAHSYIAPLTLGILLLLCTHYWLSRAAQVNLIEKKGVPFIEYAFAAVLAGGVFWWGCGDALYHLLELIGTHALFNGHGWANSLGLIVPGLCYIPLDLYLLKQNSQNVKHAASPRRGQVLALLAGGILSFAIGAATALYAWVTTLFGSPIANWQQTMHIGLAAFLVGALLIIIYFSAARREHLFTTSPKQVPEEPVTPPTVLPTQVLSIEQILDELLAGKISKAEAVQQLSQRETHPEQPPQKEQVPAEAQKELENNVSNNL
jgi:Domain of unknown function (DUF5671)